MSSRSVARSVVQECSGSCEARLRMIAVFGAVLPQGTGSNSEPIARRLGRTRHAPGLNPRTGLCQAQAPFATWIGELRLCTALAASQAGEAWSRSRIKQISARVAKPFLSRPLQRHADDLRRHELSRRFGRSVRQIGRVSSRAILEVNSTSGGRHGLTLRIFISGVRLAMSRPRQFVCG